MAYPPVQHRSIKTVSATSTALAFTSNVTAGNAIIVVGTSWVQNLDAGTVTDSRSQSYALVAHSENTNPRVAIFIAHNVAAGATTVTLNPTGGANDLDLAIFEYSGLPTSSSTDQVANGSTGSDSTYESGTTAAIIATGELMVAAAVSEGTTATPTVAAPFTMEENIITTANIPLMVADASSASTAGQSTVFTANTFPWAACIAVFKLAGGAVDPFPLLPGHGISPLYRM
jgi:hypothetical protein